MDKNRGIFKGLRLITHKNPAMVFAFGWVAIMPALGTLSLVPFLIQNFHFLQQPDIMTLPTSLIYLIISASLMGLALLPTTIVAGLSGFLWGWEVFIFVILGYTLATIIGYGLGKKADEDSLQLLFIEYPKVKELVERKREHMGELIFFIRLSPIIPFAFSNLLFALLKTGWIKVVIYGLFGMLPRTALVFFSGTLASDIYAAIQQKEISGKGWIFLILLVLSIAGIWRFLKKRDSAA